MSSGAKRSYKFKSTICPDCGVKFSTYPNRFQELMELWGGRCWDCRKPIKRSRDSGTERLCAQRLHAPCGSLIKNRANKRCAEYFDCIHWGLCLDATARKNWNGWVKMKPTGEESGNEVPSVQ